jgi:hypothetical protein
MMPRSWRNTGRDTNGATSQCAIGRRHDRSRTSTTNAVQENLRSDPQPSRQDIQLTREIIAAARPMRIQVHDHVIVGAGKHYSMREKGLI